MKNTRPDRQGEHRTAFEKNRRRIMQSQTVCGICGRPVDFSLKFPHPMSATVDHIIPVNRGGHPSDIENLQLAHFCCNRQKSDKLSGNEAASVAVEETISNRVLPQSFDWRNYKPKNSDETQ